MLAFRGFEARLRREHNERMSLAWHIAALSRAKKLPKLKTLLARERNRAPQTQEQQMTIARLISSLSAGAITAKKD